MRAAIYCRVSQDRRGTGRSVAEQEVEGRAVCAREGWDVAEVFVDNDRSASRYARKGRPDWQRLTEALATEPIDVLVVWEISRATRDRAVWAALVEVCLDRDVRLCVEGKLHDPADPDDAFILDLTSSLAVRESAVTRKRVQRHMRANAAAGRPHGRRLFGYSREYSPTTGALSKQVVQFEEAGVVREAARRVLAGETTYSVAKDFAARGVPSPGKRPWDALTLRRALTNPAYAGRRIHQGRDVGPADWPAILDAATFARLAAIFADPARVTTRGGCRHLLSGLAVCGVCGGPIYVKPNNKPAYVCKQGFHISRAVEPLERFVVDVVLARLSQPDVLGLLGSGDDSEVQAALDEAAAIQARLDGYVDEAAAGRLTPTSLSRIEAQLLPQIEAAHKRARPSSVPSIVAELAGRADVEALWEGLTLEQRRAVISALMLVRVHPTGIGRRVFDPSAIEIEWRTT